MLYHAFAASCSTTPASSIISTKGCELPSMMGISGALISIRQLSIPMPTNAARTCSTVQTFALLSSNVVPREVSVTKSQSALIEVDREDQHVEIEIQIRGLQVSKSCLH